MSEPVAAPLGMLAELTHRCPLHCPYCSNPLELTGRADELSTEQWCDVLDQARQLGVLQLHLSGGEPLARPDLPELVTHAHELGCYLNLVTSGLSLTVDVASDLADRGLDHVQLSIQDADAGEANRIAGVRGHDRKLAAARVIKGLELPLTVNVVLHRGNLDRVGEIIDLADSMGADRLELANTQYYGWAARNRSALLPTKAQLESADQVVAEAGERVSDRMDLIYVLADYYGDRPKPCMQGWGRQQLTVAPDGTVLPCPVAASIPGLRCENVRERPLAEIWYSSRSFNAFRGTEWMQEPCRSCERREIDFGGCRCQAYQLTGDAAATDPVCGLSPHRGLVDDILAGVPTSDVPDPVPRTMPSERTSR